MNSSKDSKTPWWKSLLSPNDDLPGRTNHYVPVFYLNHWTSGPDKKLWYYSKGYQGKILENRISPNSTAFEFDLNTLKKSPYSGIDEQNRQIIEDELGKLDNDAAPILIKLIGERTSLSEVERRTWLNYVLLLSERAPQKLSENERRGDVIVEKVNDKIKAQWSNTRLINDLIEFNKADNFVYNQVRLRLFQHAKERSYYEGKADLEWWVIDVAKTPIEFFTSCSPVITDVESASSDTIIMLQMALTPKKLWICAPKGSQFDDDLLKTLLITFNFRLMLLKPRYIYSLNPIVDGIHMKYQKALWQCL